MISVVNLGRCEYGTALRLQEHLVELRKENRVSDVLLLVEHPAVITLGRNAKESNIVAPREFLARQGVELFEINRGGDVTFHGPGQLVAYPIFDLRGFSPKLGAVDYVRNLEEVLMRICAHYRIETQRIKGMTGVWTYAEAPLRLLKKHPSEDDRSGADTSSSLETRNLKLETFSERKIAAIGVHISRGVTSHGFALNVTTDLDSFKLIVPCGLTKPVTSIEWEIGLHPALDQVIPIATRSFGEVFHSQVLWLESLHDLIPDAPLPEDTPAKAPEELRRLREEDTYLA